MKAVLLVQVVLGTVDRLVEAGLVAPADNPLVLRHFGAEVVAENLVQFAASQIAFAEAVHESRVAENAGAVVDFDIQTSLGLVQAVGPMVVGGWVLVEMGSYCQDFHQDWYQWVVNSRHQIDHKMPHPTRTFSHHARLDYLLSQRQSVFLSQLSNR